MFFRSKLNPWRSFTERNYLGWESGLHFSSRILIHGAGFSGLSLGCFLLKNNFKDFLIYEPHRAGGLIGTDRLNLGIREWAANGYLSGGEAFSELETLLGIESTECAQNSNRKFIVRKGSLCSLPTSLGEFFTEPFLTMPSKALLLPRLIKFLLLGKPHPQWSLAEFAKQALGPEVSLSLAPAMVAGIYGGSASEVCLGTAFPQVYARFEGLRKAKKKKNRAALRSYTGGLETLIGSMTQKLSSHLVKELPSWSKDQGQNLLHIATLPAYKLTDVLPGSLEPIAHMAKKCVKYVPIVSVSAFVPRNHLKNYRAGFGVLVPPQETYSMLGVLFNHEIFPDRVFDVSMASLNFLYGGAKHPELINESDDTLVSLAERECRDLLNLEGSFIEATVRKIPDAIPQYTRELGEFWEFSHRTLLTHNWNAVHQWVLFGNYTGQVALRGICEGARFLSHDILQWQGGSGNDNQRSTST